MSWLDKLGENIKYAHTVNNLGPAYAVTGQVKEDLRKQGKEEEAREIEKAEAIGTVGGAIAGLSLPALSTVAKTIKWGLTTPLGRQVSKKAIGDMLVGAGAYFGVDGLSTTVTGKTVGKNIADRTEWTGLPYQVREFVGDWANPGGWLTWGNGSKIVNSLYNQGRNLVYRGKTLLASLNPNISFKVHKSSPLLSLKRKIDLEAMMYVYDDTWMHKPYLQDAVAIASTKNKAKALDRIYDGRYTVGPEESFKRRNSTGKLRKLFMLEHPTSSVVGPNMSPHTTFLEELERALRVFAKKYAADFEKALNSNVKYDVNTLGSGVYGEAEGVIIGPRARQAVKIASPKNSTDPMHLLAVNHEAAGHASGNFNDGYIYNYLKENNIVDWDNVSSYFKDADRGEIGQHLAELADWLGFTAKKSGRYKRPFGKATINKTDILQFRDAMAKEGIDVQHTIWGNILDMDKFVEFLNKHPFVLALPITTGAGLNVISDSTSILLHKSGGSIKIKKKNLGSFTRYCNGKVTEECIRKGKNSSNPTTRKRANFAWVARHKFKHEEGGKLNYLNYFN